MLALLPSLGAFIFYCFIFIFYNINRFGLALSWISCPRVGGSIKTQQVGLYSPAFISRHVRVLDVM